MTTQTHEGMVPEWTRGDRLRKARMVNGWTVAEFAKLALCSERTVNHYEGDKVSRPRRLLLSKWADVTGVSLEWIETGRDSHSGPDGGNEVSSTQRYAGNLHYLPAA